MFRSIGFLIVLWGLSQFFGPAFTAFGSAMTEAFKTIELAASISQAQLEEIER